ncbi:hypothetical protein GWO64_011575 [Corynebacterium macginleyi]|uniref:hypothetical protein n=1 Tax=Corynebacterium macginleyi TaxID=38290 RepID=UPI00190CA1EA|nr:hypothetical protein [Corynebacterium macginleyi]QRJ57823.1 hypothetical protein GWO64_011575 [Corynebacterium macginleyi]
MKLLWHTTEWAWVTVLLILLLYPALAGDKWGAFTFLLPVLPILTYQPSFNKYQVLGLSSQIWNEHRRIMVTVFAAVAMAGTAARQGWWALPIYAVALGWALWKKPTPTRTGYSTTPLGIASKLGRFPPTLDAQAVYRPQIRIWLMVVVFLAINVVLSLMSTLWEPMESIVLMAWILFAVFISQPMGTLRDTLRDYVTLGGTRRRWATMTAATGLIIVLGCAAVGLALSFREATAEVDAAMTAIAAVTVPGLTYLEFLEKRTLGVFVAYILSIAALVWLFIQGYVSAAVGMFISLGIYAIWVATLPIYARRISSLWEKGLAGWLGMK